MSSSYTSTSSSSPSPSDSYSSSSSASYSSSLSGSSVLVKKAQLKRKAEEELTQPTNSKREKVDLEKVKAVPLLEEEDQVMMTTKEKEKTDVRMEEEAVGGVKGTCIEGETENIQVSVDFVIHQNEREKDMEQIKERINRMLDLLSTFEKPSKICVLFK